jgi:hypothetical protein
VQQIADWLQKLGLGQYAQRFADNDISFAVLPDLTDQDLKELGVASLGHRRQLLRAITERKGGEEGTPTLSTEDIGTYCPARYCRTPPSNGDVLRPCGLNGTISTHGP